MSEKSKSVKQIEPAQLLAALAQLTPEDRALYEDDVRLFGTGIIEQIGARFRRVPPSAVFLGVAPPSQDSEARGG